MHLSFFIWSSTHSACRIPMAVEQASVMFGRA
jgi:hypothetical protein